MKSLASVGRNSFLCLWAILWVTGLLFTCYPAKAQTLFTTHFGAASGDGVGWAVAGLDDLNADAVPDYAVSRPQTSSTAGASVGAVDVYSGRNATLLYTIFGTAAGDRFGHSIEKMFGDYNADGVNDFIVGAPRDGLGVPQPGYASVISGATGAVLLTMNGPAAAIGYGWAVTGLGDVDANGIPDFAISAPFENLNRGVVRAYYGGSTNFMFSRTSVSVNAYHGFSLAAEPATPVFPGGRLYVGAPGIAQAYGYYPPMGFTFFNAGSTALTRLGWSMAIIGDLDGDGLSELAVGLPGAVGPPIPAGGQLRVYDGAAGFQVVIALGPTIGGSPTTSGSMGVSVAPAGDVDGDGYPDIAVGDLGPINGAGTSQGVLRIVSSGTQQFLQTISGAATGDHFSFSIDQLGDVNADGIFEMLAGAPLLNSGATPNAGAALYGSLANIGASVQTVVPSCNGAGITLSAGLPRLGQNLNISVNGTGPGLLLASFPVPAFSYLGCSIGVDLYAPLLVMPFTANAGWSTNFSLPLDYTFAGQEVVVQAQVGGGISNAERLRLGPL